MYNVWHLLSIIDTPNPTDDQRAILLLDAEKAFDWVEWMYLWSVLKCFGFGPPFYTYGTSFLYKFFCTVVDRDKLLKCFSAWQRYSTRQGCPLSSPLLFAFSLEPLAQAIHQDHIISPITIDNFKHHISLFADDILL